MNTADTTKSDPEERTFLCDDELIRFLKKNRRAYAHVRTEAGRSASTQLHVKALIADIERGDFATFTFCTYGTAVWIQSEPAPAWLEKQRDRARMLKRIANLERAIASNAHSDSAFAASMMDWHQRDLAAAKERVARIDAWFANRAKQSAAA